MPAFPPLGINWDGEAIRCRSVLPFGVLDRLRQATRREDAAAVVGFAEAAVVPDDRDLWRRLCLDTTPEAAGAAIVTMLGALVPEYLARLRDAALIQAN